VSRRLAFWVTCLACVVLGGCAVKEEKTELPPRPGPNMDFETEVERQDGRLRIHYTYRNNEDEPAVVFNGLPAVDGPGPRKADPNAVYVQDGGGAVAVLIKGRASARTPRPGPPFTFRGTVVDPREEFTETFSVALPLSIRWPFNDIDSLEEPIRSVSFCLSYALVSEVHPQPGGDAKHPVYAHDSSTGESYTTCSPEISIE